MTPFMSVTHRSSSSGNHVESSGLSSENKYVGDDGESAEWTAKDDSILKNWNY